VVLFLMGQEGRFGWMNYAALAQSNDWSIVAAMLLARLLVATMLKM
jgi:hypothetical protein